MENRSRLQTNKPLTKKIMDTNQLLPFGALLLSLTLLSVVTHPRVYALLLGFEPRRTALRTRSSQSRS